MRNGKASRHNGKTQESPITFRPEKAIRNRFLNVVEASRRSQASIIHESLECRLPALEVRFHKELRRLKRKQKLQTI